MIDYKPVQLGVRAGQIPRRLAAVLPAVELPPPPDVFFTGYTGLPGFLEAATVLTVSAAAAWVGITTGLQENRNKYKKYAGWIGGVGSAVIGLLYLGGKSGYGQVIGLPAITVSPS